MIDYVKGDMIAGVTSGYIMHGCNCLGVMGGGIALQIKNTYPANYKAYKEYSESFENKRLYLLGDALAVREGNLIIINAFTQLGVGGRKAVSYDAIEEVFFKLYNGYDFDNINADVKSPDVLNIPRIGAGLGGGNWDVIEAIIKSVVPEEKVIRVWTL